MTTHKSIADIRLLGGHAALDFVNTVDAWRDRRGPDFLERYDDLVTWAERVGLIEPALTRLLRRRAAVAPAEAEAALERARTLRASLRALFQAETEPSAATEENLATLNAFLCPAHAQRELRQEEGGLGWYWSEADDLDVIVHRLAIVSADLLTSRRERRPVRECHGRNCGWLFLDTSRSGRRIWCAEETCGTGARVRRFRHRAGGGFVS